MASARVEEPGGGQEDPIDGSEGRQGDENRNGPGQRAEEFIGERHSHSFWSQKFGGGERRVEGHVGEDVDHGDQRARDGNSQRKISARGRWLGGKTVWERVPDRVLQLLDNEI